MPTELTIRSIRSLPLLLLGVVLLSACGDDGGKDGNSLNGGSNEADGTEFDTGEPCHVEVVPSGALHSAAKSQRSVLCNGTASDKAGLFLSFLFVGDTMPSDDVFTGFYVGIADLRAGNTGHFSAEVGASGGVMGGPAFNNEDCSVEITLHEPSDADTFTGDAYRVEGHGECVGSLRPWDPLSGMYKTDASGEVTITPFSFSTVVGWTY